MKTLLAALSSQWTTAHTGASIVLALCLVLLYVVVTKAIRVFPNLTLENRRQSMVYARNIVIALGVLMLAVLWGGELKTFAVSIAALAVAFTVAFKELIACAVGGLYLMVARPFSVNDIVEVNGFRGTVVDIHMFSVRMMWMGQEGRVTGKNVVIPASWFLVHPVQNESFTGQFGIATVSVDVPWEESPLEHQDALLRAAETVTGPYLQEAKDHLKALEHEQAVDLPGGAPKTVLQSPVDKKQRIQVYYAVRNKERAVTQQAVLQEYFKNRPVPIK